MNGHYMIRTYQLLNHEGMRKRGFKPKLKMVKSRRGNNFNLEKTELKGGKIYPIRRETSSEKLGVYNYFSTNKPRSTPINKVTGERYLVQFVGYFSAQVKGRKPIIVMGITNGYPADSMPPREVMVEEAEGNAQLQASWKFFKKSDVHIELSLLRGGYRYHANK